MKRVVVTGIGMLSPLGATFDATWEALVANTSGVRPMPEWADIRGLRAAVAAPAAPFDLPDHYTRKRLRSMSRAGVMAVRATELALENAGLLYDPILRSGRSGVAYGSCLSGSDTLLSIARHCLDRDAQGMQASSFTQAMSHSCAANVSIFFGLRGRVIPTSSACTSASQGLGYAAETIRAGVQTVMLAGGAEELSVPLLLLFDSMYATSQCKDGVDRSPRPFDISRDGLVVAEAACTFVLEELEYARARGARIHAEVVGFGTNSDGEHITAPTPETMREAVALSLSDAGLTPREIGFVHAHATGTVLGDVAEATALAPLFGDSTPIGALKSYFGHSLGACGSLEAALSIRMMHEELFVPVRNLEVTAPECTALDIIKAVPRKLSTEFVMSNNFAFGGVNTSLVFRRWR
ncbi:MAG: beta-ketoacyl-ACP synthase [Pseudomonadota bacterium]